MVLSYLLQQPQLFLPPGLSLLQIAASKRSIDFRLFLLLFLCLEALLMRPEASVDILLRKGVLDKVGMHLVTSRTWYFVLGEIGVSFL